MSFIRVVGWVLWKDLLTEWRTKEGVTAMLFFALLVIVLMHFSLTFDQEKVREVGPGILWLAISFTAVVGMGKSFLAERSNDCLEGLQIAPVSKGAVYLGKLAANFLFIALAECVLLPLFIVFFNVEIGNRLAVLVGVLALGTLGLAILATLFAAITANIRAREVMFPLLLLPLCVPVLLGGVYATRGVLNQEPWALVGPWIRLLTAFDVIFLITSFWAFEWVLED
jgi:heme exporter protein B